MSVTSFAPYLMRSSQFVSEAIAIVVNPAMIAGVRRLVCTESSAQARKRFESELIPMAPVGVSDAAAWARDRVDALFGVCFSDDAWHSMLPTGVPVVLIKESAIEGRMQVQDALKRVHVAAVSDALSSGVVVPEGVLADYQIYIEAMSADREVY
jgi:hypothetical protein